MSNERELPAILQPNQRTELLRLVDKAGKYGLSPVQTAMLIGINENEYQMLAFADPEVARTYQQAKLSVVMDCLDVLQEIVNNADPDNKQRFSAAKYLYEMHTGKTQINTLVAIQNISPDYARTNNNIKLIETLDAETIKQIRND